MIAMIRFVTHGSKGYSLIEASEEDVDGVGRRYVAVHRLCGVAWDVLDGMSDEHEVHHIDPVPWFNGEENVEALPPDEHGRVTREQEAERRVVADGGST